MPIPIQKGRLGRGLASLIGETPEADARLPAHGEQRLLSIDQLHPSGHNPRKSFDDLELIDLTDSIRQKGLLQPIIARPDRARGWRHRQSGHVADVARKGWRGGVRRGHAAASR